MKKFALFLLCLTFLFVSLKAFADDDITSEGEVIKSEQNIANAKKIKHYKIKKTVNTYKDKIKLTCPNCNFPEIIKNYYNSIEGLNFVNYPDTGWFCLHMKSLEKVYYNRIRIEKDSLEYDKKLQTSCMPYSFNFEAIQPAISKILSVQPLYIYEINSYYNSPTFYDEEVKIEDGNLIFTLKEVFKARELTYFEEQKVNFIQKNKIDIIDTIKNTNSADKLFKALNSNVKYPFENYPKSFVIYVSYNQKPIYKELIFYENGKKIKTLKFTQDYQFLFPDSNSKINRSIKYSVNNKEYEIVISFSDSDSIITQNGNNFKWGIIDKNGKEKVEFIYNYLYPLTGLIKENLIIPEDLNSKKINNTDIKMKYLGKSKESNIFMAVQGDYKLIIDDRNNIILKINRYSMEDKIDNEIINKKIKRQILKQIKKDKINNTKDKAIDEIKSVIGNIKDILMTPFILILVLLWYWGIID